MLRVDAEGKGRLYSGCTAATVGTHTHTTTLAHARAHARTQRTLRSGRSQDPQGPPTSSANGPRSAWALWLRAEKRALLGSLTRTLADLLSPSGASSPALGRQAAFP